MKTKLQNILDNILLFFGYMILSVNQYMKIKGTTERVLDLNKQMADVISELKAEIEGLNNKIRVLENNTTNKVRKTTIKIKK